MINNIIQKKLNGLFKMKNPKKIQKKIKNKASTNVKQKKIDNKHWTWFVDMQGKDFKNPKRNSHFFI